MVPAVSLQTKKIKGPFIKGLTLKLWCFICAAFSDHVRDLIYTGQSALLENTYLIYFKWQTMIQCLLWPKII